MAEIEKADNRGRAGADFPPEWGTPPGSPYSEERAAWVADNVRKMQADPRVKLRQLSRAEEQRQTAELEGLIALVESHRLPETADRLRRLRDSLA